MGKNIAFGERIKQARVALGAKRKALARWARISPARLEMIEAGQLDNNDLPEPEQRALASALRRPLEWFVRGVVSPLHIQERGIAYRVEEGLRQGHFAFSPAECPNCRNGASGSRCGVCGHPLE